MAWTSRFVDTFAEEGAGDTPLVSHTPDTGLSWTSLISGHASTKPEVDQTTDTLEMDYYSGLGIHWITADISGTWGTYQRAEIKYATIYATTNACSPGIHLQDAAGGGDGYFAGYNGGGPDVRSHRLDNGTRSSALEVAAGTDSTLLRGISSESDGKIWIWESGAHLGTGIADTTYSGGSPGLAFSSSFAAGNKDDYEAFDDGAAASWPHNPLGHPLKGAFGGPLG